MTNLKGIKINTGIADSEFEPIIPEGVTLCKIDESKVYKLERQRDELIESTKGRKLTEEEFEKVENLRKKIAEMRCESYQSTQTYEEYMGERFICVSNGKGAYRIDTYMNKILETKLNTCVNEITLKQHYCKDNQILWREYDCSPGSCKDGICTKK